jgi:hypothetical protein
MLPMVRTRALTRMYLRYVRDSDLFRYYKGDEGFFTLVTLLINELAVHLNFRDLNSECIYSP